MELDSWVYPSIERLAALGYIHSEYLDMRPWTRIECALMLLEARDRIENQGTAPAQADLFYNALAEEFTRELATLDGKGVERSVRVESLYTEVVAINGKPLNDGYHFGQTVINNFGRPYQEGFNTYDGFSGYGSACRFTIYIRGENQHAPSAPAYSLAARQAIATADGNPLQPAVPVSQVDRFTLLDTYVSSDLDNWNLAFGKQSLWWGPGEGGALLFSDNAEPIYMFRANRVRDFRVPYVSETGSAGKSPEFRAG